MENKNKEKNNLNELPKELISGASNFPSDSNFGITKPPSNTSSFASSHGTFLSAMSNSTTKIQTKNTYKSETRVVQTNRIELTCLKYKDNRKTIDFTTK